MPFLCHLAYRHFKRLTLAIGAGESNMDNITDENQARYHVVTLLRDGKLEEAEEALTTFAHSGIISCENEVFYRFLLEAAMRRSKSGSKEASGESRKPAVSERKM
jgi:hypothetical protein